MKCIYHVHVGCLAYFYFDVITEQSLKSAFFSLDSIWPIWLGGGLDFDILNTASLLLQFGSVEPIDLLPLCMTLTSFGCSIIKHFCTAFMNDKLFYFARTHATMLAALLFACDSMKINKATTNYLELFWHEPFDLMTDKASSNNSVVNNYGLQGFITSALIKVTHGTMKIFAPDLQATFILASYFNVINDPSSCPHCDIIH